MDKNNIEDFYPLSPMQQGMLFHSLYAPESGVYHEQISCILHGNLDIQAFEHAWQTMVHRHPILRTSFITGDLKEPVQIVQKKVELKIEQLSWINQTEKEQAASFEMYLQEDQRRGFDLTNAPLMRLALIHTASQSYQFIWSFHHILLDGWSVPILLQEMLTVYTTFGAGEIISLPNTRPYKDYIRWLKAQNIQEAEAYWRCKLQGFTEPTPLIMERKADTDSDIGSRQIEIEQRIGPEITETLRTLAQQNQITMNTIIQGGWALLLSHYCNEEDIVFGITTSGRPVDLAGAEKMVGLFINTLPLRINIPEEQPIIEWLRSIQSQALEMRQYEYSPLTQVQGWSEIPRGAALFKSILVFENYPVTTVSLEGEGALQVSNIHSVEQTNYPLNLVAGADQELMLRILFNSGDFDEDSIQRMLDHLVTILEDFAANPTAPVGAIPLLTDAERRQLVETWNNTDAPLSLDTSIQELFEAVARVNPNATAVKYQRKILTYAQLNEQANQLANHLQQLGAKTEDIIAVCMDRGTNLIIAELAVLKAGAAYLPIDPTYPPDRLSYMLTDSNTNILLTQQKLFDRGIFTNTSDGIQIICLDTDWPKISFEDPTNPIRASAIDNLAYVIYTSGSTGRPKGVLLEQRGLLNLINWHQHTFCITKNDRSTQLAGQGFDASVWEIWPYLTAGAAIIIPDSETRASPILLQQWLISEDITISFVPTPMAEELLSLEWPAKVSLRYLLTGGDRLHSYPSTEIPFVLVNNYGPTEYTVVTTSGIVPVGILAGQAPTIGRPIDNTKVYILDPHQRPVPIGIPGELLISGPGLARGYLNQPELTAQKFIANPFSSDPGARLYRSGDLVRYLPGGAIEFLGRLDNQVKILGYRIELGEIEMVLCEHPEIKEAAVVSYENKPGDIRLAAYIVPTRPSLDTEEISETLKARLPAYMVPTTIKIMDSLPITSNGKVDRKALPLPDHHQISRNGKIIEPRDLLELQLRLIWEDVLGVQPISMQDNFFELGGHSLIAVHLMARIKERLDIDFPMMTLFQEPTIEGLATALRELHPPLDESPLVPIHPKGNSLPLFFIHPSGGSVHWYTDLAAALGKDQPFYGLQAIGLTGKNPIQTQIEVMAATYIQAIRSQQPVGPYQIGSWSLGVIIAYEIAQQLNAQGEEVAFLGLLDQGPNLPQEKPEDDADYLVQVFGQNIPLNLQELRNLNPENQVRRVLEIAKREHFVYPNISFEQFNHFIHILRTQTEAWRNYHCKPYPGNLTLFRAIEQDHSDCPTRDLGWSTLVEGNVSVIDVPGDHLTMLHAPHIRKLAEQVKQCLAEIKVTPVQVKETDR